MLNRKIVNDTFTTAEIAAASTPAANPKKAKSTNHPAVSVMVNAAISTLKERRGSSIHAIKKYMEANYTVDVDRLSPFIKRYLKNAVASGIILQMTGTGASGSFRMAPQTKGKSKKAAEPTAAKKDSKTAKPKSVVRLIKMSPKPTVPKKSPKRLKPKSDAKAKKTEKPAAPKKSVKLYNNNKVAAALKPKAKPVKSPKKAKGVNAKAPKPKTAKTAKEPATDIAKNL